MDAFGAKINHFRWRRKTRNKSTRRFPVSECHLIRDASAYTRLWPYTTTFIASNRATLLGSYKKRRCKIASRQSERYINNEEVTLLIIALLDLVFAFTTSYALTYFTVYTVPGLPYLALPYLTLPFLTLSHFSSPHITHFIALLSLILPHLSHLTLVTLP